jgi:hypothetical protein
VQAEYRAASMKAFLVLNGIFFFLYFCIFCVKEKMMAEEVISVQSIHYYSSIFWMIKELRNLFERKFSPFAA